MARRLTDTVAMMLAPTPDARAVFANHGSWFTASLERCLEASAEASGLALGVGVVGVAGRLGGGLSLIVGMTAHAGRRAGWLAGGSTGKGGV